MKSEPPTAKGFFFEKFAGALLCHLSKDKQVQEFTSSILHKRDRAQALKRNELN